MSFNTERKRILFVHHVSSIGGGSYCLLNIIKSINRSLFEPIVLLCGHGTLVEELCKLEVKVIFLPSLTQIPYNHSLFRIASIKGYLHVFRSLRCFKAVLQREHIDIVYLNNMMIAPYLIPAKKCGCKTVLHVREHWPLNEHKGQLNWLRKIVNENCDKLVAINNYSASIFPEKESTIVYDWIDMTERYKYISLDELLGEDCSGKKVILHTGGLSRMKGADYVIKAFSKYVKGDEYRLLVLDGIYPTNKWRDRIKLILYHLGIDRGVEVRKIIEADKRIKCVPAIFELTHIIQQSYCFMSYFRIPHANLSLAENIILGKPCLAADTEEAREYSNNGEYAMLITPNRTSQFEEKIIEFLKNIDYWRIAAEKGSSVIAGVFDSKKNSDKLSRVLEEL